MNENAFQKWWSGLRPWIVKGNEVAREFNVSRNVTFYMRESDAREFWESIVSAAEQQEVQGWKIMRRFGPQNDTELSAYVPVASCESFEDFEALIKAAAEPHSLICVKLQAKDKAPETKDGTERPQDVS